MRGVTLARRMAAPVAAGLVLAATSALAGDPVPGEPPFQSEGEISFFADLAAFRGQGGDTEQEIYVAVPNDEIEFRQEEEGWVGEIVFEVALRDSNGDEAYRAESELTPRAAERLDAEDRAIVQVLRERVRLAPGLYLLEVRLTDRRSQKPGLFDRIRNVKNRGTVESWIRVPELTAGAGVSDVVLVRTARVARSGDAWSRRGVDFDPNPSRYYGLAAPSVRCFAEVHADEGWEEGDAFLVQSQVIDASGMPLAERTGRAVPKAAAFGITDELGLERRVPAGTYRFVLTILDERTRALYRTERPFEVIWAVSSWGREPDDVLQEMALILTDSEYSTLEKLQPGAREVYLAQFWHEIDPDPTDADNAVLEEFRRRVAFADRQFAGPLRRGILTDRGRVYVRYGPPDDETYQFSASSFGGLEGSLERVAEPGERATLGSRPSASFLDADEFREGDVSDVASQRGSATVKSQQLLVWTYDGRGKALRPDHQELSGRSHRGLKFLFADPMGNGEFQIIGSSGTTVY